MDGYRILHPVVGSESRAYSLAGEIEQLTVNLQTQVLQVY